VSGFDWSLPYSSRRSPVLARNVVAASQPLAAQAGLRMLLEGGNAVDAAIATAIALTVVEPTSNGIGSDAFAIVWDGTKLHGLNASGRSPAAWTPARFVPTLSGTMPARGWGSVTVPGAVSGWSALSERFGRLSFEKLFGPAVHYARHGFPVSPVIARDWAGAAETLKDFPDFARAFLVRGRAPDPGETWSFEDQARTLERIAETKGEAFYRGEIAEKIAAHAKATGAGAPLLTAQDLAEHQADWVDPISVDYRGVTLEEIPPNGQGLAALIALGILEHFPLSEHAVDSADSVHLQIEAMKIAFADARRYVADAGAMEFDPHELLGKDYLARRARLIDMRKAKSPEFGVPHEGDTVYLTTADESGMMVSFIQSNYAGFGSGIVVPGTGISLQNRGSGFTLQEGHPNQVGPRKRPYHTIIPAFVTKEGEPLMSFGVMGGPMQPQGHVQMMVRIFDYGQNPQAAADAPRWQVLDGPSPAVAGASARKGGTNVVLEPGVSEEVAEELSRRGHHVSRGPNAGGAQLIVKLGRHASGDLHSGYLAASEPRKDGQAVGY